MKKIRFVGFSVRVCDRQKTFPYVLVKDLLNMSRHDIVIGIKRTVCAQTLHVQAGVIYEVIYNVISGHLLMSSPCFPMEAGPGRLSPSAKYNLFRYSAWLLLSNKNRYVELFGGGSCAYLPFYNRLSYYVCTPPRLGMFVDNKGAYCTSTNNMRRDNIPWTIPTINKAKVEGKLFYVQWKPWVI